MEKKNGKGTEYLDGNYIFKGEFKNGNIFEGEGYDREKFTEKLTHCNWIEIRWNKAYDLINGKGFVEKYNKDKDIIFIGDYLNGQRNGKGKEYNKNLNLIFEGEYLNGNRNGKGKEFDDFGEVEFEGEYLNGQKYGKWKEYGILNKLS